MKYPIWGLIALSLLSGEALAQKTDVLLFRNGDRLTGEIRSLDRGILSFNTDATGTIRVEWDEVGYLSSNQRIEVLLENGRKYLGNLTHAEEEEHIEVVVNGGSTDILRRRVVGMVPIEESFIEQLDVDISLGYNLTKAGDVGQTNAIVDTSYRRDKNGASFYFDTTLTNQTIRTTEPDGTEISITESTQRQLMRGTFDRYFANRWVAKGLLSFERNDDLGIDLRSTVGGVGGRYLRQTNSHRLQLLGGLGYTQEDISGSDETQNSFEGIGVLVVDWFRYDTPELDVSSTFTLFPSLSDPGRYRSNILINFRWEIIADLFWGLSLYHDYDSKPVNPTAAQEDFGINSTLGWSF